MAQHQSTQDVHALIAEFSSEIKDVIGKSNRSAIVAELDTNIWKKRSRRIFGSSGRPSAKAPRTRGSSSSTNKENNNNGTTTSATKSSSSSSLQSQNESSSGESRSSNVGGDRQGKRVYSCTYYCIATFVYRVVFV